MGALRAKPAMAAEAIKLCMKDGSYQMVSSYEVRGARVRYFSLERSEWEEVPVEMVDFAATKRAQEEARTASQKQLEEAKELDQERFFKPPAQGLEIAPGIRLPGDDGIFTLEGKRVVRLVQSTAELVTDRKRAALVLAMPLPVAKARSLAVLPGAKGAIRLTSPLPVFYVQSDDKLGSRLELIRLREGKDFRVVEALEISRARGSSPVEERNSVPLERKQLAPNVLSLKPLAPLEPAEYVLGELLGEKLNLEVWDFGYNKWEVAR